jgi:hypothetical protein
MSARTIRAIQRRATDHTVYRFSAQQYTAKGRAVDDPGTPLTIKMWEQPMSGDDLRRLPEGLRTEEVLKFYSLAELLDAEVSSNQPPDEIEINGTRWEVLKVWDWERDGGYWKVFATRKGQ